MPNARITTSDRQRNAPLFPARATRWSVQVVWNEGQVIDSTERFCRDNVELGACRYRPNSIRTATASWTSTGQEVAYDYSLRGDRIAISNYEPVEGMENET